MLSFHLIVSTLTTQAIAIQAGIICSIPIVCFEQIQYALSLQRRQTYCTLKLFYEQM